MDGNNYGLFLINSGGSTLHNNTMTNNTYNFGLSGITDAHFIQQIDTTNLVNGKSVLYLRNVQDEVIDPSRNAGTIYVVNGTNVTVSDQQARP